MRRRSQVLQRELPRPVEVNNAILRPANTSDSSLTDLQRAEENDALRLNPESCW